MAAMPAGKRSFGRTRRSQSAALTLGTRGQSLCRGGAPAREVFLVTLMPELYRHFMLALLLIFLAVGLPLEGMVLVYAFRRGIRLGGLCECFLYLQVWLPALCFAVAFYSAYLQPNHVEIVGTDALGAYASLYTLMFASFSLCALLGGAVGTARISAMRRRGRWLYARAVQIKL